MSSDTVVRQTPHLLPFIGGVVLAVPCTVPQNIVPSTKLQARVVSMCMGCGDLAAQLLQLLRVVSVCMRMGCGHPAAQLLRSSK